MVLTAEQNNSKTQLIGNVSALSGQNFGYHQNEEIQVEYQSKQCQTTNEEKLQCESFNEEDLTKAQENQSATGSKLDLSQNIDDIMNFFDENVATAGSPVKVNLLQPNLKTRYSSPSPFTFRKRSQFVEERPNIQELRRKYEASEHELACRSPRKSKLSKTSRKSMVTQITKMFNSKITQLMRQNSDVSKYKTLNNELSPEVKPAPKPVCKPSPKTRFKLPTYRPKLFSSPFQSPRLQRKQLPKANCLVAEEVFRQLSVKDKALLYNKFIDDLSAKNPQFAKQAEYLMEEKELTCGKVINEKQASVKHLAQEMEAKCEFPRVKISSSALQQVKSSPKPKQQSLEKADDWLDTGLDLQEMADNSSHLSSLTVTLKPSPKDKVKRQTFLSSKLFGKRKVHFQDEKSLVEPSKKRNNNQILSTIKFDIYAPPKKIRRTHGDRLTRNKVFQKLFYAWLKDKNGIDFDITNVENALESIQIHEDTMNKPLNKVENTMKSEKGICVERLLEEVSAKLETTEVETSPEEDLAKRIHKDSSETDSSIHQAVLEIAVPFEVKIPIKPSVLRKGRAPPIPSPVKSRDKKVIKSKKGPAPPIPSSASSVSSARQSDADEYESGLSCIPKTTSEESHGEQQSTNSTNKAPEFEFLKPIKPPRKKKIRRNLTSKKDATLEEAIPVQTTDSSDSDYKVTESEKKVPTTTTTHKVKKLLNQAKNMVFTSKSLHSEQMHHTAKQDSSFMELDTKLMRAMNSPRKIKSRYTLTVMSSPSPRTESDFGESDIPRTPCRETSRSWPSVVDAVKQTKLQESPVQSSEISQSTLTPNRDKSNVSNQLMVSYTDQGFETGSNEMDSPIRKVTSTESAALSNSDMPLFFKFPEKPPPRRLSNSGSGSGTKPSGYSTPVKGHSVQAATGTVQQQFNCSPITIIPLKQRRRSIYETDPRRSSITMQVINEDHPLDQHETSFSPNNITSSQSTFFPKNFRADVNLTDNPQRDGSERTSVFWITAGDFCVSIVINYNTNDRVRLLYDIFSQKSFETRELHFGIDDQKFPVRDPIEKESFLDRLPRTKGSSHYWFSTGDLAVPFNGKYMAPDKVRRLFNFVSEAVAESGILRFGVDRYEFSSVPEFSYSNPKLSMESNYSMLVGLQGASNGLEGRSKYAWPSTITSSTHSNAIKTSDLDHSDFESEECNNGDMRLSFSPFDNNYFDFSSLDGASMTTPRSSDAMMSPEMFSFEYENEPLDLLFEDTNKKNLDQPQTSKKQEHVTNGKPLSVPQMLHIIQGLQNKLKYVKNRMHSLSNYYANSTNFWTNELEQLKDTPEYILKLQAIVAEITNIGAETGFKNCSQQQLESFTFFLSRYADICVANCSKHMGIIKDALMEKRAVLV